jgi:protein-S-isoprenylcysteine O-methyltransferase Ste14
MLWIRAFLFSVLVPGSVAIWVPLDLIGFRTPADGFWQLGWILFVFGVAIYIRCLRNFVAAGGTPMIFFARPLKPIVGSEPQRLVQTDIYKYSRNPMYLAVVTIILGEAIAFASRRIAVYCVVLFIVFHLVVTLMEEPHLRARDGAAYESYCRQVPRWIWFSASPKRSSTGIVRQQ